MFLKVIFMLFGLMLAVCTSCSSSPTSGSTSPSAVASSPSPQPSTIPTPVSYDPCILMTAQEATALTGVSYGAGKEDVANGLKECIYGYQTADVFQIGIAQAPDLATAQVDEQEAEAVLQQAANKGLPVTQVQGIGDAAAEVQGSLSRSGTTINLSAIYVIKGTIFFTINDVAVSRAAPSNAALQGQASTVLSRL
jgi:hypothetical protein